MNDYETILDNLETARIYAEAEFERLCNAKQPVDASVFQSIGGGIAAAIRLLQTYMKCNEKVRDKE